MKLLSTAAAALVAFQPAIDKVIDPTQIQPPQNTSLGSILMWVASGGGALLVTGALSKVAYESIPKAILAWRGAYRKADEGTDHAKLQTALEQILCLKDENGRLGNELATYMALAKSKDEMISALQTQNATEVVRNRAMHDRLNAAHAENVKLTHDLTALTQSVVTNNGKLIDRASRTGETVTVAIDPTSQPIATHNVDSEVTP